MNIFSYNEKSNNCFARLFKIVINTNFPPEDPKHIVKRPGIKLSVFGQTPGTKVENLNYFINCLIYMMIIINIKL